MQRQVNIKAKRLTDQSYVAPHSIAREINVVADKPLFQKPPVSNRRKLGRSIRLCLPVCEIVIFHQANPQQDIQAVAERESIEAQYGRRSHVVAEIQEPASRE